MTAFADLHASSTPLRFGILEGDSPWPPRDILSSQAHIGVESIDAEEAISDSAPWEVALLPPWLALNLEDVRFVPGIGVVVAANEVQLDKLPRDIAEERLVAGLAGTEFDADAQNAWHSLTDLPFVSRVWACRRRVPYPAIRGALSAAHQAAVANDRPAEYRNHQIASVESDSLRFLTDLLKRHDRLPAHAEVVFC